MYQYNCEACQALLTEREVRTLRCSITRFEPGSEVPAGLCRTCGGYVFRVDMSTQATKARNVCRAILGHPEYIEVPEDARVNFPGDGTAWVECWVRVNPDGPVSPAH